jgi:hypothetical protein
MLDELNNFVKHKNSLEPKCLSPCEGTADQLH